MNEGEVNGTAVVPTALLTPLTAQTRHASVSVMTAGVEKMLCRPSDDGTAAQTTFLVGRVQMYGRPSDTPVPIGRPDVPRGHHEPL